MKIRDNLLRTVGLGSNQAREEGGTPDECQNTVVGRPRRSWSYLKISVGATITAATMVLGFAAASGRALIVWEEIHDRGGLCAFDVVREVDAFGAKCAENTRSDETSA
jgi:hypothetical protein